MIFIIRKARDHPMARYSPDHNEKTRARVVELAAAPIRASGLDSLSIAGVIADAGLTHGGFYGHFTSRDARLATAIDPLFDVAIDTVAPIPNQVDGWRGGGGANCRRPATLERYAGRRAKVRTD